MLIKTPSRLHIALIDLNGSYARIDGGIGLTLENPKFILEAEPSDATAIEFAKTISNCPERSACIGKVTAAAEKIISHFSLEEGYHFTVHQLYPAHSGLGSGTQMSLAAGKLITEQIGETISSVELATIIGRGGTSGIGVHAFDHGGFIADGGHSCKEKKTFMPSSASDANPPLLLGRYEFPEDWGVLLAIPNKGACFSGKEELDIFQTHCPLPRHDVEQVSHLIFMNLIPFLLEKDIESFGHVLDQIQATGFNKVELTLQPPEVTNLMNAMRDAGAFGVGISSFGPAVFTVYDRSNQDIVASTREYLGDGGMVIATKAQNHGAEIFR
ncbi:hypothetical protein McpSp1_16080 [Methanocorpusculaceae archaeon Sp1]|nr:hypothetical protein [Methanocorpusculaceae archaeon Sp1]